MNHINEIHNKFDSLIHSLDLVNDINTYLTKEYTDTRNISIHSNDHNSDDIITISVDKADIISPLISTVRYELRTYYSKKELRYVESELLFTGVFKKKITEKGIIVKADITYCADENTMWFSDCDLFFERASF